MIPALNHTDSKRGAVSFLRGLKIPVWGQIRGVAAEQRNKSEGSACQEKRLLAERGDRGTLWAAWGLSSAEGAQSSA